MMIGIYDQYELWIRLCYTQEGPEEYAAFLEKERVEFENFEGFLPMKRCGGGWGRFRLADCLPSEIPKPIRTKRDH